MSNLPDVGEWLKQFEGSEAKIWAEDPESNTEKVAFISKVYLTYRVLLKCLGRDLVGVRHRFSEFEAMRTELKNRYTQYGILVPSMPPKKMFGQDEAFIKERTQGLTLFCQSIVANPWLRHDKVWIEFMKSNFGSLSEPSSYSGEQMNMGEVMLLTSFAVLEPPPNGYQRMIELKEEILLTEKKTRAVLEQVRALQANLQATSNTYLLMGSAFIDWGEAENTNVKAFSGDIYGTTRCVLQKQEKVATNISAASTMITKKTMADVTQPNLVATLVIAALEHECSRLESFKELFKAHDDITTAIDSLAFKEQKLKGAKDIKRDQVAETQKQLVEKRQTLIHFYKGLFHYTLPVNVKERANAMRSTLAAFTSMLFISGHEQQEHAAAFFKEVSVSPEAATHEAADTLDLLSIKPLSYPVNPPPSACGIEHIPAVSTPWTQLFQDAISKNERGTYQQSAPVVTAPPVQSPPPATASVSSTFGNFFSKSTPAPTPAAAPAPTPAAAPAPTPAAVPAGSRGSLPTVLGRPGYKSNSPTPQATVSPAASSNSLMQECNDEEDIAAPVPQVQAVNDSSAVASPPAPPSERSKDLLNSLMGSDDKSSSVWD